ncbi:hypothetical protein [Bradyrhizobium sp. NP1]|uniref:hypothetical protein n=1 Tax=Bradyrhizobium sp. NP1 TaxID=3049772 RepID=UPI0025A60804|nr:hypothetical protein [Bradyrhizobium sp. NP1]WJR79239.1 hypothetical protein QOU61_05460 [Bradyrhizobium sp. NP1]
MEELWAIALRTDLPQLAQQKEIEARSNLKPERLDDIESSREMADFITSCSPCSSIRSLAPTFFAGFLGNFLIQDDA